MAEETRDLDDCIDDAKEVLADCLDGDGGANYLRRHGADDKVGDLIHECADGAVPVYNWDLIDVFRSSTELWCMEPDCDFDGDDGIIGAISRVIYDAISAALYEYANDLEGDPIQCEEPDCDNEDDHDEPVDEEPRCTAHCGGLQTCAQCRDEAEPEKGPPNESCGSCGADIGPSDSYPWHEADEDCRAVRQPNAPVEGVIRHQECGCPIGRAGHSAHRINTGGERGGLPFAVGLVSESGIMREFATEAEASAYIGTLPDHADGRYYLDGPPEEGAAQ